MRRDDFPLKISHVVQRIEEEYRVRATTYYETRKSESFHRLVRRLIVRFGFTYRRPTRSVLSYEQLISEQEVFVSTVGTAVAATYSGPGILMPMRLAFTTTIRRRTSSPSMALARAAK
ncbi:hypothetical protein PybrP1_006439 [[Pythium] brassicae (nom. inval.)]|nr:hypothetical protein PybrP1_006439 [[Pythium] brassicae (nom. inval.)]